MLWIALAFMALWLYERGYRKDCAYWAKHWQQRTRYWTEQCIAANVRNRDARS